MHSTHNNLLNNMTYKTAIEAVKRHLGPAYVDAIDAHALSYANQAAVATTRADRVDSESRRLKDAGQALREALAFEFHKIGDVPREIDEWDTLVSALPNVQGER